jgi:tetratricopeptide (TPR) repeat protein
MDGLPAAFYTLILRRLGFASVVAGWLLLGVAVAQTGNNRPILTPDSKARGASSSIPEVSASYSRALELYHSGFPEYSVELFRVSFEADKNFLLAKAAEMQSYAALSLADHAALVRRQLLQEPGGKEFLQWFEAPGRMETSSPPPGDHQVLPPPSSYGLSDLEKSFPYSQELFALALRHYSQNPADRMRVLRLYAAYYSRQWEHRIVLMEHLLDLVRKEQPDAPNWISTALWRIRQEKYRRGAGYSFRPDPVESDFAMLLKRYPDSFAAACVQYSIALERAVEGRHDEAAALLKQVIEKIRESQGVEIPCNARINLFFFAAREEARAGRYTTAADFLRSAKHAEASCAEYAPCLYLPSPQKIPVEAALGVDYAFNRICGAGQGWKLSNFTFGLDRSGRIFEYGGVWWESISVDMESLAAELGEADTSARGEPALESLLDKIQRTSDPASGVLLRETYLNRILNALDSEDNDPSFPKRGTQEWISLLVKTEGFLQYLFEHQGQAPHLDLRRVAQKLGEEYDKRIPKSWIAPNLPALLALAVHDYEAALQILAKYHDYSNPNRACDASMLRGIALRALYGTGAEIEFYLQDLKQLRERQYRFWYCYTGIALRAIAVLRHDQLPKVAVQLCLDTIKYLNELPEVEGRIHIIELEASIRFHLGTLYEELGDKEHAAAEFRQIIEKTEGRNMSLYDASMDLGGGLRDNIFKLAVERLNTLR